MTNARPYVKPYSIEALEEQLAGLTPSTPETIVAKVHKTYFEEYFGSKGVQAATMVVEQKYVDRDFLDDYAAYYATCFQTYERHCSRLHFFTAKFCEDEFLALLSGKPSALSQEMLQSSYLGFIVVKPLPAYVIGRTCLKTYESDNGRRHFPITRKYHANLMGIPLEVETLAFQEQDRAAAACATTALWVTFQGTGVLFAHQIPSPVTITKAANKRVSSTMRTLPSNGLSVSQMADAIHQIGLDPLVIDLKKTSLPKQTLLNMVYTHLRGGIAPLLTFNIRDGGHAVVVTGYSLGKRCQTLCKNYGTVFRWSRIDKFYVHDDQIGPFARMEFDTADDKLITSWKNKKSECGIKVEPTTLLIPLYHKIRVPVERIIEAVTAFSKVLDTLQREKTFQKIIKKHKGMSAPFSLEWDLYLTTTNKLKRSVFQIPCIGVKHKIEALCAHLPKYLWRATAFHQDDPFFDLLFDATDVERGKMFVRAIEYQPVYSALLRAMPESMPVKGQGAPDVQGIFDWFSHRPEEVE